jgi:hypothetical protein
MAEVNRTELPLTEARIDRRRLPLLSSSEPPKLCPRFGHGLSKNALRSKFRSNSSASSTLTS